MLSHRITDVLSGSFPVGEAITIQGWVRTRRDSKAGLSFVQVHDGSTFDPIQVVAQNSLPNYEDVITKISTGCSVVATGEDHAGQQIDDFSEQLAGCALCLLCCSSGADLVCHGRLRLQRRAQQVFQRQAQLMHFTKMAGAQGDAILVGTDLAYFPG